MTRAPQVVLVALDPPAPDPAWTTAPATARETLRGAYAVALLRAAGVPARQLSGRTATGVGPLAHEARREGAPLVAVDAGPSPSGAVVLLTRLLLDGPDAPTVAWTGVPAAAREAVAAQAPEGVALLGPDHERGLLALALGGVPGPQDDLRALPSPWTTGVLAPGLAAELGVEHARPAGHDGPATTATAAGPHPAAVALRRHAADRIGAELRWIDERAVGTPVVPLVGPSLLSADDEALDAVAAADLRRIRPALPAEADAPPELLRRAAALGVARLDVPLDAPLDPETRAAVERLARTAEVPVAVALRARRGGDDEAVDPDVEWLAGLGVAPALRWTDELGAPAAPPAAFAVPELRGMPAVAAVLRAEREVPRRLLDALRGVRVVGRGPRADVHDLLWSADDPAQHGAWIARALGPDGLLVRLDGGPADALPGVPTAVATTSGPDLELPTGDRLALRGWAAPGDVPLDTRVVLEVATDADRARLREDADRAAADGTLPAVADHARWTLSDEGALLGLVAPPARLERLWVDHDGLRASRTGPVVGRVGDDLEAVRTRAAELGGPGSGPEDPAVLRLLRALLAVRALRTRGVEGPVRVAGVGGPVHPATTGEHRPTAGLLVAAGEVLHLVDPVDERVSRVTADTALVWELLATSASPSEAAPRLAAARGLEDAAAVRAVRQVLAGLAPSLAPAPGVAA